MLNAKRKEQVRYFIISVNVWHLFSIDQQGACSQVLKLPDKVTGPVSLRFYYTFVTFDCHLYPYATSACSHGHVCWIAAILNTLAANLTL